MGNGHDPTFLEKNHIKILFTSNGLLRAALFLMYKIRHEITLDH